MTATPAPARPAIIAKKPVARRRRPWRAAVSKPRAPFLAPLPLAKHTLKGHR